MAIAQSQKQDFNGALSILKIANVKFPDNTQIKDAIQSIEGEINDTKLAKASDLYNEGQYKAAIEIYSNINPMTEEILLSLATCWQNLNNNTQALNAYTQAFELNPTNADTAYYIATILIDNEGMQDKGIEYLNKALAIDPEHADAKQLQAYLAEQNDMKKLESAMNLFEAEQYEQSLSLLNEIIEKTPQNAYALYYRGMIYDTKEKFKEAIADYEKAIVLNGELTILNYLLGIDYDTLNKSKQALKFYETFVANYSEEDDFKTYAVSRIKDLKNVQ